MLPRHYVEQGMSKSALARQFGSGRGTIHRWITSGELNRDLGAEVVHDRPRPPVPSTLGRYKPVILARLGAFPDLSAVRLFEEVEATA